MKFYLPIITFILTMSLLAGCSNPHSGNKTLAVTQQPPSFSIAFTNGSSRDDVLRQLKQSNGTILKNSAELLRVEFRGAQIETPLRVDLTFVDGKLAKTVEIHE